MSTGGDRGSGHTPDAVWDARGVFPLSPLACGARPLFTPPLGLCPYTSAVCKPPDAPRRRRPFEPRPLRIPDLPRGREPTEAERIDREAALALLALEVPDCPCWTAYWHAYCRQVRDGDERIPPPPLCEHILDCDSDIDPAHWRDLCALFDPGGYDEPPPPPHPRVFLTWADAVRVYTLRTAAGYQMRHPDDVFELPGVSVEAIRGRRQGNLMADTRGKSK